MSSELVTVAAISAGAAILAAVVTSVLTDCLARRRQDRRLKQELLGKLRGLRRAHEYALRSQIDAHLATCMAWLVARLAPLEHDRQVSGAIAIEEERRFALAHIEAVKVAGVIGAAFGLLVALYPAEEEYLNRLGMLFFESRPELPPPPTSFPFPIEEYNDKGHKWKLKQIELWVDSISAAELEPLDKLAGFLKDQLGQPPLRRALARLTHAWRQFKKAALSGDC